MGKRIGDYIHYHAENYRRYGLTLRGEGGDTSSNYNFSKILEEFKSKLKNYGNSEALEKLERDIGKILGKVKPDNEIEAQNIEKIWERVEKQLLEDYEYNVGQINRSTANITQVKLSDSEKTLNASIDKIQTKSKQGFYQTGTLIRRLRGLESVLNDLTGNQQKISLQGKINSLYKEIALIANYQEEDLRQRNIKDLIHPISAKDGGDSLVNQINELIKTYTRLPNLNLQKGDLFEFLLTYVPALAREDLAELFEKTEKEIEKELGSTKLGDARLDVLIDPELLPQNFDFKQLSKKEVQVGDNTYLSLGTSQQKIDVSIYNKDISIPPIKISAKNINLENVYDVHLVSKSPFLANVQTIDTIFLNHYLNLAVEHPDEVNVDKNALTSAHLAMKTMLLYTALSGSLLGREAANIFVYNNNQTGETRVIDLVQMIKDNISKIDEITKITLNSIDLNGVKFKNQWQKAGDETRIDNLILDLHAKKLDVSLNHDYLKQNLTR